MIKEIASLPLYLLKQESHLHAFSNFIGSLEQDGFFIKKDGKNVVEISQYRSLEFNHIVIEFPNELSHEVTLCKFYNADGWLSTVPALSTGISRSAFYEVSSVASSLVSMLTRGLSIKNPDKIIREPFCKSIFSKFVSTFNIFRCPKCGALTFKRDNWEHTESRFTEDRIGHGLNAIATIIFLGGHGAGGEWSQATKPSEKKSGFNLTCTNCKYVKSVTISC